MHILDLVAAPLVRGGAPLRALGAAPPLSQQAGQKQPQHPQDLVLGRLTESRQQAPR